MANEDLSIDFLCIHNIGISWVGVLPLETQRQNTGLGSSANDLGVCIHLLLHAGRIFANLWDRPGVDGASIGDWGVLCSVLEMDR